MDENTSDMVVPLLREMRAENARQFDDIAKRHAEVIARLDKMEATQVSFRHALGADSLLSKLVTGDSHERIETLEKWVQEEESRAS